MNEGQRRRSWPGWRLPRDSAPVSETVRVLRTRVFVWAQGAGARLNYQGDWLRQADELSQTERKDAQHTSACPHVSVVAGFARICVSKQETVLAPRHCVRAL